jgi:NSS family neurotransmitter:Na+ symporter
VLFGLVIQWVTTVQLPLMGLFYFVVVGWLWKRGNTLHKANNTAKDVWLSLWGNYLRFVCPILLTIVFVNVAFGLAH